MLIYLYAYLTSFKPCFSDLDLNRTLVPPSLTPCKYHLKSIPFSFFVHISQTVHLLSHCPQSNTQSSLLILSNHSFSSKSNDKKSSSIILPHAFLCYHASARAIPHTLVQELAILPDIPHNNMYYIEKSPVQITTRACSANQLGCD